MISKLNRVKEGWRYIHTAPLMFYVVCRVSETCKQPTGTHDRWRFLIW